MSNIQKIARQALITFRSRDPAAFEANFEKLKSLANAIKASDINLEQPDKDLSKNSKLFGAPVSYINILESKYFTLGVFILKNGVSIPLHDHPGMHGVCKVLYGTVRVKSFDVLPSHCDSNPEEQRLHNFSQRKPIPCRFNGDKVFGVDSEPCLLSPAAGNFHSIHSVHGQAAFLDILAPPYTAGERDCSYYRECSFTSSKPISTANESIRWLIEIPQPPDFYCDSMPYNGPPVELEE